MYIHVEQKYVIYKSQTRVYIAVESKASLNTFSNTSLIKANKINILKISISRDNI